MLRAAARIQTRITGLCQRHTERGATAVEYGLMVALISIVIIVAVALLGTNLKGMFTKVAGSV